MQNDQPAADKEFILVFGFAGLIWLLAIGLDIRAHGVRIPRETQALGFLMLFQPFALVLYTWSLVTLLAGTLMFIVVSKFPE